MRMHGGGCGRVGLAWALGALIGCGARASSNRATASPAPVTRAPPAPRAASAASVPEGGAQTASGARADAGAAAVNGVPDDGIAGIWYESPVVPGADPLDYHALFPDGRWRFQRTAHARCDEGVVERVGRWRLDGAVLTFEERGRATRYVVAARAYRAYRACVARGPEQGCDRFFRGPDGCGGTGTRVRVELLAAPVETHAALGACVPGTTQFEGRAMTQDDLEMNRAPDKPCIAFDRDSWWRYPRERDDAPLADEMESQVRLYLRWLAFDRAQQQWRPATAADVGDAPDAP